MRTRSAYDSWSRIVVLFDRGAPLDEVRTEAEKALTVATNSELELAAELIAGPLRLTRTLLGITPKFGSFDEAGFDEARHEQGLETKPLLAYAAARYWVRKLQARFFAEDYGTALAAAGKAQALIGSRHPILGAAEYHFYAGLARAARAPDASAAYEDLPLIAAHHAQLHVWAEKRAASFADRAALLGAELARLTRREVDAERLYAEAIQLSREHGYVQNEALGHELLARFHAEHGRGVLSDACFHAARVCYERWGAVGKLRQLDQNQLGADVWQDDYVDFSEEFGAAQGFAGGSGFDHDEFDRWT